MRYIAAILLVLGVLVADRQAFANTNTGEAQGAARVREAETKLAELGYWVVKVDGVADASTKHAITAFQKVEGLKRTGSLNAVTLERLRAASRPVPKHQGVAHVEIDITRQVLFMVDDEGVVTHVLPVSTGNNERYFSEGKWQKAYTPRGAFKVQRQIKGNRKAALGTLYYPSYFNGGIAIHGSNSIPATAASHGCARIPRFSEKKMSDLVKVGMPVFVYD
jgi:peptidoglycan hydrolase-like protein with peptidoglycan-binding domain